MKIDVTITPQDSHEESNISKGQQSLPSDKGEASDGVVSPTVSKNFGGDDIDQVILHGVTFRSGSKHPKTDTSDKVKTKAKKKGYITGAHGSASAKKKADIRRARANRHKGK